MATGARNGVGREGGSVKHPAHQFATRQQQYDSAKSGMWLFLSTEVLLFSGLFCAYAVYRANHPEVFVYAHQFLDKTLGGINTLILILSSLTAAWAVRAAQLGQRRLLLGLLAATLLCGACFLGIKGIEYEHKWKHGLLWGKLYRPDVSEVAAPARGEQRAAAASATTAAPAVSTGSAAAATTAAPAVSTGSAAAAATAAPVAPAASGARGDPVRIRSNIAPAARGPSGLARPARGGAAAGGGAEGSGALPGAIASESALPAGERPKNVQVFFSIYFVMTGLHALHVIGGMAAFTVLLVRAARGRFGPDDFTPVDLVALYWHVVDLVWIYLFPLLYLIR